MADFFGEIASDVAAAVVTAALPLIFCALRPAARKKKKAYCCPVLKSLIPVTLYRA